MQKSYKLLAIVTLLAICTSAQTIYTIAGNGSGSYSGDGGPATSAGIWQPVGVSLGNSSNLYISDYFNNRIRMVSSTGIISTFAGTGISGYSGDGGPATAAELNNPSAVKVDGSGNVYIADAGNNRIRIVTTSGIITTCAGNGIKGYSGDGGLATAAELNNPQCVSVNPSGYVFISDGGNNCIRVINTSGIISTGAGNGIAGYSGDGGQATAAELNNPNGFAVGDSGNFFIADENNNCIRIVNISGIISTCAGNGIAGYSGDGGVAAAAELNHPSGIKTGYDGINLYIADMDNNRIREVNTTGIITTVAGNGIGGYSGDGGPATDAEINKPVNIALDGFDDIYIADAANNRIREVIGISGINGLATPAGEVNVYPKPNNGDMVQTVGGQDNTGLRIYDLIGNEIYTQP